MEKVDMAATAHAQSYSLGPAKKRLLCMLRVLKLIRCCCNCRVN